ncbi:MAG: F-type H+-transporting ATPase subunit delta [Pseudonocardiales bacterium]|nr:F-type H+-transporting ATPase subunit delta [Pseudonocardiales bacterium]
MIHAASREALATLRERAEAVAGRFTTADGLSGLSAELYAVAELLNGQPRLRRNLGDPATAPESREQLAQRLLDGKIGTSALQLVKDAVSLRWSSAWNLLDALETIADEALFRAAEQQGSLDEVEDELFRFERILEVESDLVSLLDDQSVPGTRRVTLLESVLGDKVHPLTLALVEHAVTSQRKRSVRLAIDNLLEMAAALRARSVAKVLSAVPLTDAQQRRLAEALTQLYGRVISVRTAVDPTVRGGLVIRVGDELIDGSVSARLASARAALAG